MQRQHWLISLSFLLVFATNIVFARDIRVPMKGTPALTAEVPDGWVIGRETRTTLNVVDQLPANIAFSFNLLLDPRTPREFVSEEMRNAGGPVPTEKGAIKIAGLKGELFESTAKTKSGRKIEVSHYIARLDATHLIAIAVVIPVKAPRSIRKTVKEIVASLKLQR